MLPRVRDAVLPEMEDGGRQHGVGTTRSQTFTQMIEVARAAGGDDRNVHGGGDGFKEWQVVPITSAIAVHACEQDLPCTPASRLAGPRDDVEAAGAAPTMRVDTPALALRLAPSVDGDDDTLAAKDVRPGVDEVRIADGRCVDRNLVGAGGEQVPNVAHRAHTTPDCQRDEDLIGRPLHDVDHRLAAIGRGRDVEEHQLIGAFAIVESGQLDGIAGIAQIHELDAFNHAAAGHIQTGNDPAVGTGIGKTVVNIDGVRTQHGASAGRVSARASPRSIRPSYNARPTIAPVAPAAMTALMSSSDAMPPEAMTSASTFS